MKKRKRTTFGRLFLKSASLSIAVGAVIFIAFGIILRGSVKSSLTSAAKETYSNNLQYIMSVNSDKNALTLADIRMSRDGYFYFNLFGAESGKAFSSEYTDGCELYSYIADKDGRIVASNKRKMLTYLSEVEGTDIGGRYYYYPENDDPFWQKYREMSKETDGNHGIEVQLDDAYLNPEDFTFIPVGAGLSLMHYDNPEGLSTPTLLMSENIISEIPENTDGLIYAANAKGKYSIGFAAIRGEDPTEFDRFVTPAKDTVGINTVGIEIAGGRMTATESGEITINGEQYVMTAAALFPLSELDGVYIAAAVIIFALCLIAAALWSFRRNTVNRAQYQIEDYQRALINNLAHDIKTPLTAVMGYAENAETAADGEELSRYLTAIEENVRYITEIANRTLELNHLNELTPKRENVELIAVARELSEKYLLLLKEKNIAISITGEWTLTADRESVRAILENLISNAVKYTPSGGSITIGAKKGSFIVENTASGKVDTEKIAEPFAKGDSARHERSAGLGLSIAVAAAEGSGLRLTVSSSEDKFTALLSER